MPKVGILLTNTGTPDAPTRSAVKRYLREFLSDKRIVQLPRLVWLPLLYFIILPFRSGKSAKLYREIWLDGDSPIRSYSNNLAEKISAHMTDSGIEIAIEVGMNYGNPSIPDAMQRLRKQNIDKLFILPLFPQYSNSTTASTFDRVAKHLKKWPALPEITHSYDYAENRSYIRALAHSVEHYWQEHGKPEHLLISFHGLPERFISAGDPYDKRCAKTAELLSEELQLPADKWTLCFQSQFGYDKWLKPSTQQLIEDLPKQGIKHVDVVCPGFSLDCLETLEEIANTGKKDFIAAGGTNLRLIPCLNDNQQHVELLVDLIVEKIQPQATG